MNASDPQPRAVPLLNPAISSGARRALGCLVGLAALAAMSWVLHRKTSEREERGRVLLEQLRRDHAGKVAWFDSDDAVGWSSLKEIGAPGAVRTLKLSGSPLRIAWSSTGQQLYVVVETSAPDDVDSIVAVDVAAGTSRLLLNLGAQKFEDKVIDQDEFWVAPVGDAESEFDRIFFKVGKKSWYSVEGKSGRVRPEAGAPARKWDQTLCPDGRHRLVHGGSDDDAWLEITNGTAGVKVTPLNAIEPGAWWCER